MVHAPRSCRRPAGTRWPRVLKQCGQVTTILRLTCSTPSNTLVERLDVLRGQLLEQELVAGAAGRSRRCRSRRRRAPGTSRRRWRAARRRPWWSSWRGPRRRRRSRPRTGTRSPSKLSTSLPKTGTSKSISSIQLSAVLGVLAPRVALVLQVLEQHAELGRGTPTRSAPGSGACRRCGRRARCRPGTARRRRRRWCSDHSTSGSMTPPCSAVPTSGRSPDRAGARGLEAATPGRACGLVGVAVASTRPTSSPPMSLRPAGRAGTGALANTWSRRSMISSLGDSGLPVFHAGHCDWQRPHSVQVVKSSKPFQVKSSTWPAPKVSVVGVGVLEVERLAARHHGLQRAEGDAAVVLTLEVDVEERSEAVPGDTPRDVAADDVRARSCRDISLTNAKIDDHRRGSRAAAWRGSSVKKSVHMWPCAVGRRSCRPSRRSCRGPRSRTTASTK